MYVHYLDYTNISTCAPMVAWRMSRRYSISTEVLANNSPEDVKTSPWIRVFSAFMSRIGEELILVLHIPKRKSLSVWYQVTGEVISCGTASTNSTIRKVLSRKSLILENQCVGALSCWKTKIKKGLWTVMGVLDSWQSTAIIFVL